MKAVFLTAGAAGMYCGSCMHDNALARAMRDQDVDCLLQPVYTPIRTDQESVAGERVFFGGIHIYLLQQFPWLRWVPAPLRRTLDWAPLIKAATARSQSTDASKLGELSISMLKGGEGFQASEVDRLVHWLENDLQPDAVLLTNLLIGGSLREIHRRLPNTRRVVLLQGDDIFLDYLPPDARSEALDLCRGLVDHVDRFVVHSEFYGEKMGAYFEIPPEKIVVTPLSIDMAPFDDVEPATDRAKNEFRLGYMARIAPEKGLHNLVDAFIKIADHHDDMVLHAAGWLGEQNRGYLEEQQKKIDAAGLSERFKYIGSPSLEEKVGFLRSLDLLSVPTDYHEPKGLFVLESLAARTPVIQPDHGAFGELVESTGGGLTCESNCVQSLSDTITQLKTDAELRQTLADQGHCRVRSRHSIEAAAAEMKQILFG